MTLSVDVVFKILNFLVICVGVAYIMRRYGILYVITLMRHEKQNKEATNQEYRDILQQSDQIKILSNEQELSYLAMKEKFKLWQDKVHDEDKVKQVWLQQYQQELECKQRIKLQHAQRQFIIRQQLPTILQDVSDGLQASFDKNPERQKEFVTKLVMFVKEREL